MSVLANYAFAYQISVAIFTLPLFLEILEILEIPMVAGGFFFTMAEGCLLGGFRDVVLCYPKKWIEMG